MKPIVVIPTYNERENVAAMAAAVLENLPSGGRLLFLDDNSPDSAAAVAVPAKVALTPSALSALAKYPPASAVA